ncbi:MAG: hypothetical protein LRY51_04510 [Geovibrio sp.]|nr:hypothetical protein [Geovibrio sp.]
MGRIRYTGVLLYNYDRLIQVLDAPEESLVDALRSCILDPSDPEVRKNAKKAGIEPDWIQAAENSPVYAFVKEFGLPCRFTRSSGHSPWCFMFLRSLLFCARRKRI